MKRSILYWLRAVRVPTLTAAVIPVALGSLLAFKAGALDLVGALLATLVMTFFQITANLINDVDDFRNKVDTPESLGSSRVIVDGLLTPKQLEAGAKVFFCSGIAIGLYLSVIGGIVILLLGLLGAAGAFFYTRKPFAFKYKGYGVPIIFMMFGPLPAFGAFYLSAGAFSWTPILLSIPVGLLTTAILHANDTRDIDHDDKAGIKTFAMAIGRKNAVRFYLVLVISSFLFVLLFIALGQLPTWSALVFLSAPLALSLIKSIRTPKKIRAIDHKTAMLQLVFGVLLLVSIII